MHSRKTILLGFLKKYRKLVGLTFFIGLIANVLTILLPIFVATSYGILFGIQSTRASLLGGLPAYIQDSFPNYLLLFVVLLCAKGLFDFSYRYGIGLLGERIVKDLRETIFEHQLRMRMEIYDEKGTGRYLLRYSGDLTSIQSYLTKGVIRFIGDCGLLILAFGFLFWLSNILGILVISIFALLVFGLTFLNKQLYQLSIQMRNKKSGLLSFVSSRLLAILSVQSFNKEVPEQKRYFKRSTQLFEIGRSFQKISAGIGAIIPVAAYLILGLVLAFAYYAQHWELRGLGSESFLAVIFLLISLLPVFRRVLRVESVWKKGQISYDKLAALLNLATTPQRNKPDFQFIEGKIEINNLSFSFQGKKVFENFSERITRNGNSLIALPTGGGKTTLIKLLIGIYQPDEGEILIDGQRTTEVNLKSLRKHIAVIGEDWKLYGKTVFEAVSYSRKTNRRAKVQHLLDKFQENTPDNNKIQIDDTIGEFGAKLSKGQIKMLMIIRALLTRKPILLMENPFEQLDKATKNHYLQILNEYRRKSLLVYFSIQKNIKTIEEEIAVSSLLHPLPPSNSPC